MRGFHQICAGTSLRLKKMASRGQGRGHCSGTWSSREEHFSGSVGYSRERERLERSSDAARRGGDGSLDYTGARNPHAISHLRPHRPERLDCLDGLQSAGRSRRRPGAWPPIVERALELGVNFFDTSNSYNQGRSEAVLGEVTSRHGPADGIATKGGVARRLRPPATTRTATIRRRPFCPTSTGQLKRLRRDTIDMYMLHSPTVASSRRETGRRRSTRSSRRARSAGSASRPATTPRASGRSSTAPTPADRVRPAEPDCRGRADAAGAAAQRRDHGPHSAGARPADRQIQGRARRSPPSSTGVGRRGDRLQLRLERVEQLRFLERAARRWPRPRSASCWRIRGCTASCRGRGRSSSWRRTCRRRMRIWRRRSGGGLGSCTPRGGLRGAGRGLARGWQLPAERGWRALRRRTVSAESCG